MKKRLMYFYGWVCVRPRRWLFWRMAWATTPQWFPKKDCMGRWRLPNIHWWLLYKTVFRFFKWLDYEAWRPLCKWGDRCLKHKPLIAKIIHRIGETTAGFAISGFECFHCGSKRGCQCELSSDETGELFILKGTQSVGTEDGTDHRFWGVTICPVCGYKADYEDGSL